MRKTATIGQVHRPPASGDVSYFGSALVSLGAEIGSLDCRIVGREQPFAQYRQLVQL